MADKDRRPRLTQVKRFSGLSHDVLEILIDLILNGVYQGGDRLNESHIAQELNISRGPVREALRRLEELGLVVHHPGKGCSVKHYEKKDIEELWTLRSVLEQFAIRLACPVVTEKDIEYLQRIVDEMDRNAEEEDYRNLLELDWQFHDQLLRLAGHTLLRRTWRTLRLPIHRFLHMQKAVYGDLHVIARTHEPILSALKARDIARAERAISEHISEIAKQGLSATRGLTE